MGLWTRRVRLDVDAALEGIEDISFSDLETVLVAVRAEISRRLLDDGDPKTVTEEAFSSMFEADGLPADPVVRSGLLVCGGGKVDRSAMAHRCRFVRVGGLWVWDHPEVLSDVVRHVQGPRRSMRSISVVPAFPGDEVDMVTSRARNGVHQLVSVRSFTVTGSGLDLVSSRSVSRTDHR